MIITFIKKIKSKIENIFGVKIKKIFKNNYDVISYKSDAWISKKSSSIYNKEVEKVFFDKVTWPLICANINKEAKNIIEVGAGTGRLTSKVWEMFDNLDKKPSIKAIDISKNMLDYITPKSNLEIIVSNANNLPISNNFSNITLAMDFLMHFPNWKDLLNEMVRVTSSEGVIIFNYVSEEHIKLTKDLNLLNPNTVAFSEFTADISEAKLLDFCHENNCRLKKIIPYSFFIGNELFRPLLNNSSYINLLKEYKNIYTSDEKINLLKTYIDIENLISKNGDPKMCNLALAILIVN